MPLCRPGALWLSLVLAAGLCACSPAPDQESDRPGQPGAAPGDEWFMLHGQPGEAARLVEERLRYGGAWLDEHAGLTHAGPRLMVYLYLKRSAWEALLKDIHGRADGFSFFREGELHLLYPHEEQNGQTYVSVFHELVHDRFHRAGLGRLPLWLEEGSAQALGWRMAQAFAEQRGMRLKRKRSAESHPFLLSLETLETLKRYPESAADVRSFYYHSEWVADYLLKRMPLESYIAFLSRVNTRGSGTWRQVLKREEGWSDGDLQRLEHLVAPMGPLN